MTWVLLSLLGLALETAAIIVLGRRTTGSWQPGVPEDPRSSARDPDRASTGTLPKGG